MSNLAKELGNLLRMGPTELRAKYQEVFGDTTRTGNKEYLTKRIAWRLQMQAEGDLTERAQRRAAELANDADIRTTLPKSKSTTLQVGQTTATGNTQGSGGMPPPGTLLTRQYQGRTIQVSVLARGFDHEGVVYKSLSAIAKVVTGSHWNGHLFFGLRGGKR